VTRERPQRRRLSPLLAVAGGALALGLIAVLGVIVAVTGADLEGFRALEQAAKKVTR